MKTWSKLASVRLIIVVSIVICLQVVFPLLSHQMFSVPNDVYTAATSYWRHRLSFAACCADARDLIQADELCFAATTGDEISLFFRYQPRGLIRADFAEVVKLNLSTGRTETNVPPANACSLLTIGEQISLLPYTHLDESSLFLRGDTPCAIGIRQPDMGQGYCLYEFDGKVWNDTLLRAYIPRIKNAEFFRVCVRGNQYLVLEWSDTDTDSGIESEHCLYRNGIDFGTKEKVDKFLESYQQADLGELSSALSNAGWKHANVRLDSDWGEGARQIHGFWLTQQEQPVLILTKFGDTEIQLGWLYANGNRDRVTIPMPSQVNPLRDISSTLVTYSDAEQIFVFRDIFAGWIYIYKISNLQPQLIAQCRSPLPEVLFIEIVYFWLIATILPTTVLAILLRKNLMAVTGKTVTYDGATYCLAPFCRRVTARLVDLGIPAIVIIVAWFYSYECVGWFHDILEATKIVVESMQRCASSPFDISQLRRSQDVISSYAIYFLPIPRNPLLITIFLATQALQCVCQGIWGRTLGKVLFNLKVVGTTLRPCGIARSVLREMAMIADTVFLASFVPAISVIATTSKAQRIGDFVANTIVIDSRTTNKSPGLP